MSQFTGHINKTISVIFLVMLCVFKLNAQVFPVQVNPQLIPPYSLKLSEYGTAQSERVVVNLLLTDVADANRRVGLKLFIENNAGFSIESTNVIIGANPIILDGGTPLRLTNIDLQPYFSLQNLRGIAPQQFNRTLPEGLYRFCFEVFDERSGQPLSRKSCATAYLVLNDPPFLNLPNRGELIAQREPQNIIFQWTPRHLNATNVQYEFTLVEVWDSGMDPQAAFLASRPLYQTTTFANTLLYGPAETPLLPDKTYAWRVRAMITDGISETAVFKNDGFSEIYHFKYTGACDPPSFLLAEAQNPTSQNILWEGADHKQYKIQYRKKSAPGAKEAFVWFENNAYNERTTIYNLEPGTSYEYRVGGMCRESTGFTYSQINEFTTMIVASDTPNYSCGITPEIVITNQTPLEALVINDVFTAGDFPVTVKFVGEGNVTAPGVGETAQGGNGFYSGWGFITVPYLENTKIKVSFNGIKINSDYQLTEGIVLTDYDKNWGGVNDVSDEIEAIIDLTGSILDVLENISDSIREGKLTGADLSEVIDDISEDLTKETIGKLKEIQDDIYTLEEELEAAETEEEKKEIKEKINQANQDFADQLEAANDTIADLIVKAIEKYYRQNKSKETELVTAYGQIYDSSNTENTSSPEDDIKNEFGLEFEGDIEITELPEAFTEVFEAQKQYHLYFFSKAVAENKTDKVTVRGFIKKAMEQDVDLHKIMKASQDKGDTEQETVTVLVDAVYNTMKGLIDFYKYNYLSQ